MKPRREQEAEKIRVADKAAVLGRLMLGKLNSLAEFFEVGDRDYLALPRRALRSGMMDVDRRLQASLKAFCDTNFIGATPARLARLYDDVVESLRNYGVAAFPVPEFEASYFKLHGRSLNGSPRYATLLLSLRGMQFKFPEDQLAKDLLAALDLLKSASAGPARQASSHAAYLARQQDFAARSVVSNTFNLIEAVLSGILWEHMTELKTMSLTGKDKEMVDEPTSATLMRKLERLPALLRGPLPKSASKDNLLKIAKPFRDSLMHPSPFRAPERFGGYDKLSEFYAIDATSAKKVVRDAVAVLQLIHSHLNRTLPPWLSDLDEACTSDTPTAICVAFHKDQQGRSI